MADTDKRTGAGKRENITARSFYGITSAVHFPAGWARPGASIPPSTVAIEEIKLEGVLT